MTNEADEDLLALLKELPRVELDQLTSERVRRRAQEVYAEARGATQGRTLERRWSRAWAPAFLASAAAVYLVWAVSFCASLYR
jgi:hypothetical protein